MSSLRVRCVSCQNFSSGVFCESCNVIVPPPGELDYFEVLGEAPRPLLDEVKLRATFHKLNQMLHPDKFHSRTPRERDVALQWSTLVNQAYSTLKDPRARIRYLVSRVSNINPLEERNITGSPKVMALFMKVKKVTSQVDLFLNQAKTSSSWIVTAALAISSEAKIQKEALTQAKQDVNKAKEELMHELKDIDKEWASSQEKPSPQTITRLETLGADLSYIYKFESLLDERLMALGG